MHKSPASGHPEKLAYPTLTRPLAARTRQSVRILLTVALAVTCLLRIPALAQDSQPPADSPTQGQPAEHASDSASSTDLSDEVIKDVLSDFQRGFETHNLDKVLSVFDADAMPDFSQFRDQMIAYFRLHESFKLRYQLLQVNADKDIGTATADMELEEDPLDTLPTPKRRSAQVRFQIKRTPKGWRIIGLRPMDFFGVSL
jgi:hypothetical protein